MDILKNTKITKAAKAVVCLFSLIALIGSMVTLFSSISLGSVKDYSGLLKMATLAETIKGAGGLAVTMTILSFVFSLVAAALAFFSMHNLAFSLAGAAGSLVMFILGLIITPFCSEEWLGSKVGISMLGAGSFPGGYVAVFILLILFAIAVGGLNVLGILKDDRKFPVSNVVYQKAMPLNQKVMNKISAKSVQQPMNYPNQQYQQPMQGQPMQNQYQQPMMNPQYQPQPMQGQPINYQNQPYQQPMMNPQQAQPVQPMMGQPMQQPMNQQPMQAQPVQPMMGQPMQQPAMGQQPMQGQPMNYPNQQYQQSVQGQPMNQQQAQPVQPQYQQPMNYPNQPYQQQAQPVQGQNMSAQPVPQPVPQPTQTQSVLQPGQQNDFNHQ